MQAQKQCFPDSNLPPVLFWISVFITDFSAFSVFIYFQTSFDFES